MVIKEYTRDNFEELISLIKEHGTIARREVDDTLFSYLGPGLEKPGIKTFCAFNDGAMTSFMISSMIDGHPAWLVRLMCSKKANIFNPKKNGVCGLYDTTITYWESQGVTNFIYAQPYIFLSRSNLKIRAGSKKLQEYTPINYHMVPANTQSEHSFIRNIMKNKTYPDDTIIRWCFKK